MDFLFIILGIFFLAVCIYVINSYQECFSNFSNKEIKTLTLAEVDKITKAYDEIKSLYIRGYFSNSVEVNTQKDIIKSSIAKITNLLPNSSDKMNVNNIYYGSTSDYGIRKYLNQIDDKQFNDIKNMIPQAVRGEMKNLKIENSTTTITKSSFVIEGDSALFLNQDGIITKTAKVVPLNGDSSLLIVVPQEIELTTVQANPDPKDNTKVQVFVTAYNRTTGDSLKINKSLTYVLPGKAKKWEFNYKPYVGANYDLINGGVVAKAGLEPIIFNSKKFNMNIGGIEIRQNLKNRDSFVDLKIVQFQFK